MLSLQYDPNSDIAIYIQLARQMTRLMQEGYIVQDEHLPSVRSLSKQLALSKTTIENMYDLLVAEGYVYTKPKSGFFCGIPALKRTPFLQTDVVLQEESSIDDYDLTTRRIQVDHFDRKVWRRYSKDIYLNDQLLASYGKSQGENELRYALCQYLNSSRGVHASQEDMVISAGSQPLLYLLLSLFKQCHLRVGFIQPGFIQAQKVFENCQHDIVLLNSLDEIETTPLDFLYLTPSSLHLTLRERIELLNRLRSLNIYLIEDDYNGEMHYITPAQPAMQGLNSEDMVIYINSFSKLLLPSVRLACMVLPDSLAKELVVNLPFYNQTASKIEQLIFASYIQDGHLERQTTKMLRDAKIKKDLFEKAIQSHLPKDAYRFNETQFAFEIEARYCQDIEARAKKHRIAIGSSSNGVYALHFNSLNKDDIPLVVNWLFTKNIPTN